MKKNKKPASLISPVTAPPFVSRIPRAITYTVTFLFAFIAFHYYLKVYPQLDCAPSIFFHCYTGAIPTMKNIFYFFKLVAIYGGLTVLFFAACRGYGYVLRQYALRITTPFDLFIDIAFGLAFTIVYACVLSIFRAFVPVYAYCYVGIGCILCMYFLYTLHTHHVPTQPAKDPYADNLGTFSRLSMYLLLIVAISMTLMNATTPETFYDSLVYHLGLPQMWINHAHIYFPYENMMSFTPLNIEVLYAFAMLIKNDVLAKYFHCGLSCITLYLIYVIGKTYWSKTVGILAALIFYTTPMLLITAYKTAAECGIGFFETLAFASVIAWVRTEPSSERWKYCVISGVCMGLALGSKYTSLFALMGTLGIFVYRWCTKERTEHNIKHILIYGIVVCVVAVPWYIKNYIYTGNPVFPMFSGIIGFFGHKPGAIIDGGGAVPCTLINCLVFPWKITMALFGQEPYAGLLFLLFLPFVVFQKNKGDRLLTLLCVYVLVYVGMWLLRGRMYVRFAVPCLPLASLLFAAYFLMNDWHRVLRKGMTAILIVAAATNVLLAMQILTLNNQTLDYGTGGMSRDRYLATARPTYPSPYYDAAAWVNTTLPVNAKIVCIGENRGCFFKRDVIVDQVFMQNPMMTYVQQAKDADALYALLKQKGITHIFWNVPESTRLTGFHMYEWTARDAIVFDTFFRKYTKEVFRSCSDILLSNGMFLSSTGAQWESYKHALAHYVYVYEITPHSTNLSPSINFLIFPFVYDDGTWARLISDASFIIYLKTTYPDLWEQGMFEKK